MYIQISKAARGTERVIGINHILAYTRASDENTYVDIQGNFKPSALITWFTERGIVLQSE